MGLDFDPIEYCRSLVRTLPPYKCPVEKCTKSYKSIYGLQYHLSNYDHDNPQPLTPYVTPSRKRGRQKLAPKPIAIDDATPKEALTYLEAQKVVQFDIDGKSIKVSIEDPIPVYSKEEFEEMCKQSEGMCANHTDPPPEARVPLPEASFKELESYNICDAPPRPNAYIRFIEKSLEELDGEVEYDVDEEDTTWLAIMNDKRAAQSLNPVSIDTLELLMDRLEKESYFQQAANGQSGSIVDDDAVCCICLDGECQNTNVILFCDMCNLAVHQDCYGVPYIPEGQWLCRRCLQSPSRAVKCVLCPNTGGAFKQTDRGQWAHVVCALWIPEVRFANTVFLEPIDSIETIPAARWRLTCYICKQKNVGACIQCQRNNCYAAFHVTCAQQAGLHMQMDPVKNDGNDFQPVIVEKTAYCDAHTPACANGDSSFDGDRSREEARNKMKQARKLLAKKREFVPVILIPTIPPDRVQEISNMVHIQKKNAFIQRLIAYWTLKRQYRNGVPLLRRLQSQGHHTFGNRGIEGSPDASELYQQLKYWQCLRQDLERARLLCELVRKREKLKAQQIRVMEQCVLIELNPMEAALEKVITKLEAKDTSKIFMEPVDVTEVIDYMDVVKHPMDFSTMRKKLKACEYTSLNDLEADFDLMIRNCLAYNSKDTIYYRAGVKMREQGVTVFKAARKELETEGLIEPQKSDDCLAQEIDNEFHDLLKISPNQEVVTRMENLFDKAQRLKHGQIRLKRTKQIKIELTKLKKIVARSAFHAAEPESTISDSDSKSDVQMKTPTTSPVKTASTTSPSGVNRRTAVLLTRKKKDAFKKPVTPVKEEKSDEPAEPNEKYNSKNYKKGARSKRSNNRRSGDNQNSSPHRSNLFDRRETGNDLNQFNTIPDSFRVYRGGEQKDLSDSDESDRSYSHSTCSSCSGFTDSGSGSDYGSSMGDGRSCSECGLSSDVDDEPDSSEAIDMPTVSSKRKSQPREIVSKKPTPKLEPLQLVWAKCRGYPWYPALIIDPETPRGFIYNGVALPAPPSDVLALRKNCTEPVFLVLFFDVKRTWQWLPPDKLEILGLEKRLDEAKLVESRKAAERKAVKKAYENALQYQSQVTDENQGPAAIM